MDSLEALLLARTREQHHTALRTQLRRHTLSTNRTQHQEGLGHTHHTALQLSRSIRHTTDQQFIDIVMAHKQYVDLVAILNDQDDLAVDTILVVLQSIYDLHMRVFQLYEEQDIQVAMVQNESGLVGLLEQVCCHPNYQVSTLAHQVMDECVLFYDPLLY